jgi:UDP-4-amino-4,6-dideoxy-N-acetyl-beta-L-altrosamine transaminase
MIPYGRQSINEDDIDSVIKVLKSDYLTQGSQVPKFEKALSDYCNVSYVTAVNSATSALHISCLALNLGAGDYLWTSPISFVASANCALYCGAKVDFVDIDPKTYNMDPIRLRAKLEIAKANNKLPKIIVPVHFAGQSCDMKSIFKLSIEYGFRIIEDASHAIGGKYLGLPVGSCKYSDITVFSFHPVKIITTGEGGAALTNDSELASKLSLLRSHGVSRDNNSMSKEPDGPWYYEQISLGYNYRMTDIHAALGLSQLKRLDCFVQARNQLANQYDKLLKDVSGVCIPALNKDCYSSFHLYPIKLDKDLDRSKVFEYMRNNSVGVNVHYIPIHKQPFYKSLDTYLDLDVSQDYYKQVLTLPLFPNLSSEEQIFVVQKLQEAL